MSRPSIFKPAEPPWLAGVARSPANQCRYRYDVASMRNAAEPTSMPPCWARWGFIDADVTVESKVSPGCIRSAHDSPDSPTSSYSRQQPSAYAEDRASWRLLDPKGISREGPQDVAEGIELARADQRPRRQRARHARPWSSHAAGSGFFRSDPGYAHRVMWIAFSREWAEPKY